MTKPQEGQTVGIEYTGRLQDGTTFDSNVGQELLRFQIGEGQVIPGFEQAVRDLNVGESTETTIPPDMAYGERRDDLVVQMNSSQFPPEISPQVGMQVQLSGGEGMRPIPATIVAIEGDAVTLDANHRLAGETLIFDIKLVEVN